MKILRIIFACALGSSWVLSCYAQTNAASLYSAGWSAFNARDYNAAITDFTRSLELDPKNADVHNWRGRAKWWLKDYTGAIEDYDQAIALNPKCGGFYSNRGEARYTLKMFPEALGDYNKAIELDPMNAQAYFNRGTFKMLCLTNYPQAEADFTKAIDLHTDPHEEDLFYWRGNARMELKDFDGALGDYTKSLALSTNTDWGSAADARTNIDIARKLLLESKTK
jgi:serine/threonine-protein kinase